MRIVAVLSLSTGCVIGEPTGALQLWPPPLGGTIEAVVACDLDANGATDLVVFQSGADNQAGMYLVKGGMDLVVGDRMPVRSFSTFKPTDWKRPLAAIYAAGAVPRIYIAHSEDTLSVTELSNTLETLDAATSTIESDGAPLWTRIVDVPGGMPRVAVSNGSLIDLFSASLDDPTPIPAPDAPTWDQAQLATSYVDGTNQVVVVATTESIVRAISPSTPGIPVTYETVRSGPRWLGQTTLDLDGDGREEILGVDVAAHKVCVVDPGADTIPVTPSCVQLISSFSAEDVTLLAGQNLTTNVGLDILVAQADGAATHYTLVEDYTYVGGAISAMMTREVQVAGPARGRTVLATGRPGPPYVALTFGTDATVVCVIGPC